MPSQKQIEANRLNAQKSSGPRTSAGKAVSRFNALKSGIEAQAEVIPGEDPVKLEALLAEYRARFDTSTPERRMLVDILVNAEWMLRRIRRGEAEFWKFKDTRLSGTPYPEGRIIEYGDKVYDRVQRRINAIQRNYYRALEELKTLPTAGELQPDQPESNEQPAPEIGFVPQPPEFVMQPQVEQVGQALPPASYTTPEPPQTPPTRGLY